MLSAVSISRSSVIAADMLVIAVTWWQAVKSGSFRLAPRWNVTSQTIADALLRNGTFVTLRFPHLGRTQHVHIHRHDIFPVCVHMPSISKRRYSCKDSIVVTMNTLQLILTVVSVCPVLRLPSYHLLMFVFCWQIVSPVNQISQVTILTDP